MTCGTPVETTWQAAAGRPRRASSPTIAEHLVGIELGPELRRLLEHRGARAQPVELDVDRLLARLGLLDVGGARLAARRATATAVPSDGWPANGISPPIMKIRCR